MDFTQMFPVYVNVFNFTQIWMKLFSFAQWSYWTIPKFS